MTRRVSLVFIAFFAVFFAVATRASTALADPITVVSGQFAQRIENSRPVGNGAEVPPNQPVYYYVVLNNGGDGGDVTIVWSLDGRVVHRQRLHVGPHAHRWRTWALVRRRSAQRVEVQVLDTAGTQIHTDSLNFGQ